VLKKAACCRACDHKKGEPQWLPFSSSELVSVWTRHGWFDCNNGKQYLIRDHYRQRLAAKLATSQMTGAWRNGIGLGG